MRWPLHAIRPPTSEPGARSCLCSSQQNAQQQRRNTRPNCHHLCEIGRIIEVAQRSSSTLFRSLSFRSLNQDSNSCQTFIDFDSPVIAHYMLHRIRPGSEWSWLRNLCGGWWSVLCARSGFGRWVSYSILILSVIMYARVPDRSPVTHIFGEQYVLDTFVCSIIARVYMLLYLAEAPHKSTNSLIRDSRVVCVPVVRTIPCCTISRASFRCALQMYSI